MTTTTFLLVLLGLAFVAGDHYIPCPPSACRAVEKNDGEKIRARVNAGEPNLCTCICDGYHNTLLHVSALEECITCSDVLLDPPTKCPVDALDILDRTPLIDASRRCQVVMINLYLDHEADPNAKDFFDMTPLCYAAIFDDPICGGAVKDLIEKGADCKIGCGPDNIIPSELAVNQITKDILAQKNC